MSIPVLTLVTDKNSTSVDLDRITIRQSEAGLIINANLIDADNNAYNLTNCKVSFGENKDGGKMVDDDNVTIIDAIAGQISYKLRPEVYQASGEAWFEITNNANVLIDTTSNFHIEVIKQADLNVDNDNYWSKAEAMLTHVQAFMNKIQNDLNSYENSKTADINSLVSTTTASINKLINDTNTTLQSYKDQLADYDAKYKALDDNWAAEITKLDSQIDSIKQQAIQDFKTQRDNLDTQFTQFEADLKSDLESKLSSVISQIKTLTDTTLPDLNNKVEAVQKKIDGLKTDFESIDFTQFVKPADIEALEQKINDKLASYVKSVDGNGPDNTGNVETNAVKSVNNYAPDNSGKVDITDLLNKNFGINAGNAVYRQTLIDNIVLTGQHGDSNTIGSNIHWVDANRTTIDGLSTLFNHNTNLYYTQRSLAFMFLLMYSFSTTTSNGFVIPTNASDTRYWRPYWNTTNQSGQQIQMFHTSPDNSLPKGRQYTIQPIGLPVPGMFGDDISANTATWKPATAVVECQLVDEHYPFWMKLSTILDMITIDYIINS